MTYFKNTWYAFFSTGSSCDARYERGIHLVTTGHSSKEGLPSYVSVILEHNAQHRYGAPLLWVWRPLNTVFESGRSKTFLTPPNHPFPLEVSCNRHLLWIKFDSGTRCTAITFNQRCFFLSPWHNNSTASIGTFVYFPGFSLRLFLCEKWHKLKNVVFQCFSEPSLCFQIFFPLNFSIFLKINSGDLSHDYFLARISRGLAKSQPSFFTTVFFISGPYLMQFYRAQFFVQ